MNKTEAICIMSAEVLALRAALKLKKSRVGRFRKRLVCSGQRGSDALWFWRSRVVYPKRFTR